MARLFVASSRWVPGVSLLAVAWILLSLALKLALVSGQSRIADTWADHDDALFLRTANHILQGQWLGPYNETTMVKGPGYPLWIALSHLLGLPLHLADNLLYALACLVASRVLARITGNRFLALFGFTVLLFYPMTSGIHYLVYSRDGFYTTLTLFIAAFAVDFAGRRLQGVPASSSNPPSGQPEASGPIPRGNSAWFPALLLGLTLGIGSITREEGVWLVPLLLGTAVLVVGNDLVQRSGRLTGSLLPLAATVLLALLPPNLVSWLNSRHYGVYGVSEFKNEDFVSAYASLARVQPRKWKPWVIVPQQVRKRLYAVSPSMTELKQSLDGQSGRQWAAFGHDFLPRPYKAALAPEILTGWFIWAFRDAVREAGYYKDAVTAQAFYRRLAAEIDLACDQGKIRCGPKRWTLSPAFHGEHLQFLGLALYEWAWRVIRFPDYQAQSFPSRGTPEALAQVQSMTRDRLHPPAETSATTPAIPVSVRLLHALHDLYAKLVLPWLGLGVLALILDRVLQIPIRKERLVSITLLGLLIASRLAVMTWITVSAIPLFDIRYIFPAQPIALMLACLLTADILEVASALRKKYLGQGGLSSSRT